MVDIIRVHVPKPRDAKLRKIMELTCSGWYAYIRDLHEQPFMGGKELAWERVRAGWPEPPSTIAPLLCAGAKPGQMWAADERGVHRSDDSGKSWRLVAGYATSPPHLRGLALLQ